MTDQALSQLCDQVRELLPRVTPGEWHDDGEFVACRRPGGRVIELACVTYSNWDEDNRALIALAPPMAAALLKLREERDAAVTAVREMVTANAENMRLAASAEAKLAEIKAEMGVWRKVPAMDYPRRQIEAILASGKGE